MGRPLDLLVAGAHVWTGDPGRPRASALGVRGGRVAFVGPAEEARLLAGAETDVVEAAGKLLVPGFIDAHSHVRLGSSPLAVDLGAAASLEELTARVRAHAEAHPDHRRRRDRPPHLRTQLSVTVTTLPRARNPPRPAAAPARCACGNSAEPGCSPARCRAT